MFIPVPETVWPRAVALLRAYYLVFDKKTHSLSSTSKEIKYQLGQKVLVKILKADIEKKQVDFSLIA
jgi:exoribonuclease R